MDKQILQVTSALEGELLSERARIVQLCASITGNVDIAEDLAQEVLLEAWSHLHMLRDVDKQKQWMNGITRNVCLRWARRTGREPVQPLLLQDEDGDEYNAADFLADDYDIEVALEHKELIELLDRALALLPVETRTVMIQRYIEETPLAELAARIGARPNALAMRLQRGKLALRNLLTGELSHEAQAWLEFVRKTASEWEETSLWCVLCGQQRLLGTIDAQAGFVRVKCPVCCSHPDDVITSSYLPQTLRGIQSYKPALRRVLRWVDTFYGSGLERGYVACTHCDKTVPVRYELPITAPTWLKGSSRLHHTINTSCPFCGSDNWAALDCYALAAPEGLRFWQKHPRMRLLPINEVEAQGRPALLVTFESVKERASFSTLFERETYRKLDTFTEEN
ncbi:hypothetical protein KDA_70310 [Dictyobacter alpinus]|uniref:RNA polymerase sigma factor n=1 Tax=Dictyobacter alpinus TaxID=2014873 RepID=A0A402BJM3_9CHLR|nr:RNA polymerase sigma factor [Dictyobacter alpinus]GCE31547.1 hypothetical protein KDA_70310 [Dictyobacter alpinus]